MFRTFFVTAIVTVGLANMAWHATAAEILTPAKQAHITDFESGKVLFAKNAEVSMKPASMAKIMTVFVVFNRLAEGRYNLMTSFLCLKKLGAKVGLKHLLRWIKGIVDDLLHGVIVQSGNDAAIVLAEGIAGTEDAFVKK